MEWSWCEVNRIFGRYRFGKWVNKKDSYIFIWIKWCQWQAKFRFARVRIFTEFRHIFLKTFKAIWCKERGFSFSTRKKLPSHYAQYFHIQLFVSVSDGSTVHCGEETRWVLQWQGGNMRTATSIRNIVPYVGMVKLRRVLYFCYFRHEKCSSRLHSQDKSI